MLGDKAVSHVALLLGVLALTAGLAVAVRLSVFEPPPPPESPLLASSEKDDDDADECGAERSEEQREAELPSAPADRSHVTATHGPPCRT